jgi:hypothetical protein
LKVNNFYSVSKLLLLPDTLKINSYHNSETNQHTLNGLMTTVQKNVCGAFIAPFTVNQFFITVSNM